MKSRINKLEYKFEISYNDKYYYKNRLFHRDGDLPAYIGEDSNRVWYKNGLEHRDKGKPSTICYNGKMYWFENGNFIKRNF